MLDIDEGWFEAETINGYYVPEMIKRSFAAQMEVYEEIRKVCEHHNIRFFASYGTLLGIVRHRGFIPWDDDLDIIMMRSDMNRFLECAKKELPEEYMILHHSTQTGYRDIMMRIVNSRSIDWGEDHLRKFHGFPYVCGVDIFALDKMPRDKDMVETMCAVAVAVDNTLALLWSSEFDELKVQTVKQIEEAAGVSFDWSKPLDSQLLRFTEDVLGMYSQLPESEYDEVVMFASIMHSDVKRGIPKEYFADVIWMDYEGLVKMPAPAGYDAILRSNYGEGYMIPQIFQPHDYPYFRSQEQQLRDIAANHPEMKAQLERFFINAFV